MLFTSMSVSMIYGMPHQYLLTGKLYGVLGPIVTVFQKCAISHGSERLKITLLVPNLNGMHFFGFIFVVR